MLSCRGIGNTSKTIRHLAILVCFCALPSRSMEMFNTQFNYPCDNSFFGKGTGLIPFKVDGTDTLNLRLFYPPNWSNGDRRPALIMIFGGGWNNCCAPEFFWLWQYYSAQGFVVILPEYRLGNIDNLCLPDCKSSVRWVRAHADSLGIDPQHIIALGSSAGGQLAAATALIDGFEHTGEDLSISSMPNLLVLLWPVLDLADPSSNGFAWATQSDRTVVSPARHVDSSTPPTIIISGSNDPYKAGSQLFMNNAKNYSFDAQWDIIPNAGHDAGFRMTDTTVSNAGEDSVRSWSMAFFDEHAFLPSQMTALRNVKAKAPFAHAFSNAHQSVWYTLQGKRADARVCGCGYRVFISMTGKRQLIFLNDSSNGKK